MSAQMSRAHDLVKLVNGPMAKVYCCPFCMFHVTLRKVGLNRIRGPMGWLNHSAGAKSKTASHIRREHADRLTDAARSAT